MADRLCPPSLPLQAFKEWVKSPDVELFRSHSARKDKKSKEQRKDVAKDGGVDRAGEGGEATEVDTQEEPEDSGDAEDGTNLANQQ
eukprot:scaffold187736_cov40-Prasinocladus_malaysianus.AAC.1